MGTWCTIIWNNRKKKILRDFLTNTTNQEIYLVALINGLRALKKPCNLAIYTDYDYLLDEQTEQYSALWRGIAKLLDEHSYSIRMVPSDSQDQVYIECQELCTKYSIPEWVNYNSPLFNLELE